MIQQEFLHRYYSQQYDLAGHEKRRNMSRPKGFEEQTRRMLAQMRRTKENQVTRGLLEEYHRRIRNMAYFAFKSRQEKIIRRVQDEILKELVRLDLTMLMPDQQSSLREDFLEYMEEHDPERITVLPLFDLYLEYKQYYIENKILELVPAKPELEFPEALDMKRHFILHIGPTNSGKTYQALERLKAADKGIYLGPLRLLALEVYERMMEQGVPCTMLTGQECIVEPGSRITASTVEMADFEHRYDIAVIDEAQMVADQERGHCWTRAILGIQAPEIHICMSSIAEKVVTHLIDLCGDDYEVRRYERKTALVCEEEPFRFPEDVRPGDALVVFSKKSVLDVAGRLESQGIEASVVYGSLPPEIRRRQMQLFTSGETSVVVATDAIGMGLNLPVRRIVFIQNEKFDGTSRRGLTVQEIKQIAGRAGRFGIYDTGYVNAMGEEALDYIRQRFEAEEDPVKTVKLGFPQILLDLDEPMDALLKVWHSVEPSFPFEKVSIEETLTLYETAEKQRDWIDGFEDKRILYKMISCPIDIKDKEVVEQWMDYCRNYSADSYLDFPAFGQDRRRRGSDSSGIRRFETYYKKLDLYYQFSRRFDKEIDEEWLAAERNWTEGKIMQYLSRDKKDYIARCQYCGRLLPVGYQLRRCSRCMEQTGEKKKMRHENRPVRHHSKKRS